MGGARSGTKHLVLVGGGHAHVLVLLSLARRPLEATRITLLSDGPEAIYSGMVPGHVAGQYARSDLAIDLRALAERAGAGFVSSPAVRLSPAVRAIETQDGQLIRYDLASLDVGSTVAGLELPGVRRFALATRPAARLAAGLETLLEAARGGDGPFRVVVVGGGAAGVEVACALRARLSNEAVPRVSVLLLESSPRLVPGQPLAVAAAIERQLGARGVRVETSVRVEAVREGAIQLDDGSALAFDALLWCAGAAAPPLAQTSALPTDERGFVRVRSTLQVMGHDELFAAGDVASLESWPELPKAGVHAVRAAPILAHNLRAFSEGQPLRAFVPQRDFLVLLNLGDGRALGFKWGVCFEGRAVFRLKDWIDRRFVARFRAGTTDREDGPGRR